MKNHFIQGLALAVVFSGLAGQPLTASAQSSRKLDEIVFYQGARFKLKLVRYYENLRFHYTGEVFRVQCASARTANSPGHKMQDQGWVTLGNGSAIGSKNAAEVVQRERHNYVVIDEQTLVWTGPVFNVSFDACGSFRRWNPTTLPADLIDPVDKPSYCAPKGKLDCRHYDFQGGRQPHFDNVQVTPRGDVSFTLRSKAFKNDRAIRVHSRDFGRTWEVEPQ